MSDGFPNVNSKDMIRIVKKLGFELVRHAGSSHAIYFRKSDNKRTTIPIHGKKSLKRKTTKAICRDIGIDLEKLKKLLKK